MCGIFAWYSKEHKVLNEVLQSASHHLKHRGPDAQSTWISPTKKIGLVHTRLSIVDLSNIEMPISNEEKTAYIIANGEFYDYQNIRNDLKKSGHTFKTATDTEIAIHLYEEMGMNFLSKLRGEFSFIIWDENKRTLYAVRDRFGIKPLYYTKRNNGDFFFSSEIPTLIKTGAVSSRWDLESLVNYTHCNLYPEQTLFENILQIPAGHYLALNDYGYRIHQYWDADYPVHNSDIKNYNEAETIQEIHHELMQSISLRLAADVPVGCYLSGGLDSSALHGMASHILGKPIDAFTICFNDEMVDEGSIAKRSAQNIGSNLYPILVTDDSIVNNFEQSVLSACAPMANAAGIARYLLSQFTSRHGYKTIFSGEGSDEIFFGYTFMAWEALSDSADIFPLDKIDEFKKKLQINFPVNRAKSDNLPKNIDTITKILGYLPRWIETQGYFNASHRHLLSDEIKNRFYSHNPYTKLMDYFDVNRQLMGRDRVVQSVYLWLKSFFPNTMLNWIGDRAEMAHSIEARLPFLDHKLFNKVKNIPTQLHLKDGVEKYILREVTKPYITDEIYNRKKFMFQAPPMTLDKSNKQFQMMCDLIMSNLSNLNIYNKDKLQKFVESAHTIERSDWINYFDASTTLTTIASIAVLNAGYKVVS